MDNTQKIYQMIKDAGEITAKEIVDNIDVSRRYVFVTLKKLIDQERIQKIGTPPKVFYSIKSNTKSLPLKIKIDKTPNKLIEENFLYITPLGEYFEGIDAFVKWCSDRNMNIDKQVNEYEKILKAISKSKKGNLIDATKKFTDTFEENYLDKAYYIDFYSIPHFGKTKLGQLLLYAKQSQDKKRISKIVEEIKPIVGKFINDKEIEAVGFIPPTIKREVQFMKVLENKLNLNLPKLYITKVKTEIIVPQKTLSKLSDRILNSRNTLIYEDNRDFQKILLIDDAVGSGATLNEVARKIKIKFPKSKVYGIAITGSYKGYDVISEV